MATNLLSQESLMELAVLAGAAGKAVMEVYSRPGRPGFSTKDDQSPLTEADIRSHEIISKGLASFAPGIPILSEEADCAHDNYETYWAVDPLDGTKEFINQNGEFTVNIALVENGVSKLGVICAPALGEFWLGIHSQENQTGFAQKAKAPSMDADPKRDLLWTELSVNISAPRQSTEPFRLLASRSHGGDDIPGWLRRVIGDAVLIEKGSSLKFCFLAEGAADLYVRMGPTSIWDTAAGHAILIAAGGVVVECETGKDLTYPDPKKTLNPSFIAYVPARINFEE